MPTAIQIVAVRHGACSHSSSHRTKVKGKRTMKPNVGSRRSPNERVVTVDLDTKTGIDTYPRNVESLTSRSPTAHPLDIVQPTPTGSQTMVCSPRYRNPIVMLSIHCTLAGALMILVHTRVDTFHGKQKHST